MSEIRLIDIVNAIRKQYRQVLAIVATIFILLAVVILNETPVYRAYVLLAPSTPLVDPNPNMFANVLPSIREFGDIGVIQEQTSEKNALALLRSRAISRQFIKSANLLPILFANEWDSEKHTWRDTCIECQPTLNDGLEYFEREVRFISRDVVTGVVRINIEWTDPQLAANWANGLVSMTDRVIRERDIIEAKQSIAFLEERAQSASFESVKQLIYDLIESYAKKIMVANVKHNYAFTVIDPAVAPEADDSINIPLSFKFTLILTFALGGGVLWATIVSHSNRQSA